MDLRTRRGGSRPLSLARRPRAAPRLRALSAAIAAAVAAGPALAQPAPPAAGAAEAGAPAREGAAPATGAAVPAEEAPVSETDRQVARLHFEKGLTLLREEAWGPALAEFLLSRKLFPTRVATNNAAIALRKLQRYDEALEMFETFLRDFTMSAAERAAAQREIAELRALVGTLDITNAEPGASIVVSGEERGQYPPVKPIRVAAGTHVLRVFKEGYEPVETRVDVAGGQTVTVNAKLRRLTRSGRLRVVERAGKTVDVLVDNVVVGQTPWIGALSVGDHMVALRGAGKLGTQPTAAPVKPQELTTLSLLAEDLDASLRVDPTPPGASVWINSVNVGNGVWLGRLKVGTHRVEVKADGFVTGTRTVTLQKGQRQSLDVGLERDEDADIWRKPPKITLDVSASFLLAPTLGGEITDGCDSGCSSSLGLGGLGMIHGGYELGSGIGVGIELGGLFAAQQLDERSAALRPVGYRDPLDGTASDTLRLGGFLAGATFGYHFGERFPALLRLGAGVLVGEVRDERTGRFRTTGGESFNTFPVVDFASATYFYADPEVRLGLRLGERWEVAGSVKLLLLIGLSKPKWDRTIELAAASDGIGTYEPESLMGDFVLMIAPGASLRYQF
ncbi:PEGA domain-containing protein [Sorangium atrum]|uniref:PEGA domain-containing protein n=1 Tax=Sorangium atrum TaxID=2995308 RepID=A0ABT5C5W7_9BACT|nr:PEGA domain-containing protein [Sorangium aterium]MDC0681800.1 PEGA domain-containing protein [Sorangium aterium]